MKKIALFALAALSLCIISCAKDNSPVDIKALDAMMSELIAPGEPGAEVLVMVGDSVIFQKGYGLADMNTKAPINENTFFNIASMSKKFTAVAVLQLVEQGVLSLNDTVAKFYPEFKSQMWKSIELRHLLSHTSGVPDARGYIPREDRIAGEDSLAMQYLKDLDSINFKPGEAYEYMNPTYVMAGDIVTRVTGQDFTQYVKEHIFIPSGMEQTLYYFPNCDSIIPNMSHGYVLGEDSTFVECDYGEETFFATRPDGGIYTSVSEYSNWIREQAKIRAGQSQVLKAATLADAQSPKVEMTNEPANYGYGWAMEIRGDLPYVIYHYGGNGGYRTWGAYYPGSKIAVMVFANRGDFKTAEFKKKFEEFMK